jgi:hypothetical protein
MIKLIQRRKLNLSKFTNKKTITIIYKIKRLQIVKWKHYLSIKI